MLNKNNNCTIKNFSEIEGLELRYFYEVLLINPNWFQSLIRSYKKRKLYVSFKKAIKESNLTNIPRKQIPRFSNTSSFPFYADTWEFDNGYKIREVPVVISGNKNIIICHPLDEFNYQFS